MNKTSEEELNRNIGFSFIILNLWLILRGGIDWLRSMLATLLAYGDIWVHNTKPSLVFMTRYGYNRRVSISFVRDDNPTRFDRDTICFGEAPRTSVCTYFVPSDILPEGVLYGSTI